ncbi:MAG TPA: fructose 1,6-bisphosphatase [Syntrophorhabdaceae bacterium]|nr:fructose 1,6-bisphosphatase [Syntrophorhabdaceae bacterium]
MTKEEFVRDEPGRVERRVTATVVSADILRWLKGLSSIPISVITRAQSTLEKARHGGVIRDFRVFAMGSDLVAQITSLGKGLNSIHMHGLALEAMASALTAASEAGIYRAADGLDFFCLRPDEKVEALRIIPLDFPFTERGAEPIFVAKVMNGGMGAFNRMLFDLYFHPDKGSHQRLDGARYVAIVENIGDVRSCKKVRRLYVFGDRPEEERLFLVYPFAEEPLELQRDHVGDWGELLSMIANPAEWVISAVYAVKGRFVLSEGKFQPTRHEPAAAVSIAPALPGIPVTNPVAVLRLQGGLPAVGEAHFNLGGDFHFVVGGLDGGYHVGVVPVTMEEASIDAREAATARLAAYTYQSYGNGLIPPDHDFVDVFGQDRVQTEWLQSEARAFIRLMAGHGEFQPQMTAEMAEARAESKAAELAGYFKRIPESGQGKLDPLVEKANTDSGGNTLSDIKADAGGKVGHTTPTTLFAAVSRASLMEAKENGLIKDFRVFGVGDDLHLVMHHVSGVDANAIHLLAFRSFWREVWVTEIMGFKPYALAQDLQIGPATKGKKVEELAEPSERFVELLNETLPEPERSSIEKIRSAMAKWKAGHAGVEVKKPFAGNVTGQGPGFAEVPVGKMGNVYLLAADKAGPACFNIPLFHAAREAIREPGFQSRYGQDLAFEIWDIHRHTRIFLSARWHTDDILTLLGATNLFNVKRIWSMNRSVTGKEEVEQALGSMLLSASTERLAIITGGQYVGKDDPVLLGVEELVLPIFELLKSGYFMTQGDERGSHYMMLVPKPLPEAVGTIRSRGLHVGLVLGYGPEGITQMRDVFAEPSYHEARIRIDKINAKLWRAQGSEFTPVGVGARDVEPAYPLVKVLNRITADGSAYALPVKSVLEEVYKKLT